MNIAKIIDNQIVIGTTATFFPQTSFPASGPSAGFLAENGCYAVRDVKAYDAQTQELHSAAPYLEEGVVYTVVVVPADLTSRRIAELKQLLADSDYKVLPDYDKTTDEIKAQRQAWRVEIRTLESAQ